MSGSFRFIDNIYIEWHYNKEPIKKLMEAWDYTFKLASADGSQHFCEVVTMDDEAYYTYDGPAPTCPSAA